MARQDRSPVITLREFLREAVDAVTNIDSSFIRTIRVLLFNPGRLTASYLGGDVTAYTRPVKLFLVVNIVFFFLGPRLNVFSNTLASYSFGPFGGEIASVVQSRIESSGLPPELYRERFNTALHGNAPSLVLVIPLIFSLALALLYRRTHHIVEHAIFALHYSASFLALLLIAGVVSRVGAAIAGAPVGVTLAALALVLLAHLYRGLRLTYGRTRLTSMLLTPLTFACFVLSYGVFNYAIFLFTFVVT